MDQYVWCFITIVSDCVRYSLFREQWNFETNKKCIEHEEVTKCELVKTAVINLKILMIFRQQLLPLSLSRTTDEYFVLDVTQLVGPSHNAK